MLTSMTNEMSRIGTEFEIAQTARLASLAAIKSTVQRDLQKGHNARARVMAAQRRATKGDLKEIFGAAAFLRGAADDLTDRFARDRDKAGDMLRDHLKSFVVELQGTVEGQMERLAATRTASAQREETARRAYVKDLRRRVRTALGNADDHIKGLHKDRRGAEGVWRQHCRTARSIRKAGAKSEAGTGGDAPPHQRTTKAKKTRKTPGTLKGRRTSEENRKR